MAVNKYQEHVLVLPEDDANRQLANGFLLDPALRTRRIQIFPEAGGWNKVLDCFKLDHVREMDACHYRFMVLLIDFDGLVERLKVARAEIPERFGDRVFVLGVLTEPEALRRALQRTYEILGQAMAKDCREETGATWEHDLLQHNAGEIDRLRQRVRPFLFQ